MTIDFQKLMSEFAEDISKRTGLLTEDSVRYYVFKAFLTQDNTLNNYTLELPYDSITFGKENPYHIQLPKNDGLERRNGKLEQELDLFNSNDGEPICMEIKFHRHPTAVAFPHPQAAGSLFNDLQRLNLFEAAGCKRIHKLFLYVTDEEMNNYLGKGKEVKSTNSGKKVETTIDYRQELRDFYIGGIREFQLPKNAPDTFALSSLKSFTPVVDNENKIDLAETCSNVWKDLKLNLLYKIDGLQCKSSSIKGEKVYIRLYEVL